MRNTTIYSIAAICGLVAFFYTLITRSAYTRPPRVAGARGYLFAGDNLPETIPELEQIVKVTPQSRRGSDAWYKLGGKYRDAGNEGAAKDAWAHAGPARQRRAERSPDADTWFEAGWAYHWADDDEHAKTALEKAEELLTRQAHEANNQQSWYRLGWARKLLGNETEARMAWSRAIDRLPPKDSPSALSVDLYNLACYRSLMGESEEALDVLKRAEAAGWNDADHTEHDEDFEAIREDARFKKIVSQIRQRGMGVHIESGP